MNRIRCKGQFENFSWDYPKNLTSSSQTQKCYHFDISNFQISVWSGLLNDKVFQWLSKLTSDYWIFWSVTWMMPKTILLWCKVVLKMTRKIQFGDVHIISCKKFIYCEILSTILKTFILKIFSASWFISL